MPHFRLSSRLAPLEAILTEILIPLQTDAEKFGVLWAKKIDQNLGTRHDPTEWVRGSVQVIQRESLDSPDDWRSYPAQVEIETTYELPIQTLLHQTAREVGIHIKIPPELSRDGRLGTELARLHQDLMRSELDRKSFWEETIEQGSLDQTLNQTLVGFEPPEEWKVLSLKTKEVDSKPEANKVITTLRARLLLDEPDTLTPEETKPTWKGLRVAKADVVPVRQKTQFSCVVASLAMALRAVGISCDEDSVNEMLGAVPGRGSSWDQAISAAQYFGARVTLVCPSTIEQIRSWTDRGIPVLIGWCPEGRPWGHASCVFDVTPTGSVLVADPNIPDPDETVRNVPRKEFYQKWYEPGDKFLTRRTAMAVERDIP